MSNPAGAVLIDENVRESFHILINQFIDEASGEFLRMNCFY